MSSEFDHLWDSDIGPKQPKAVADLPWEEWRWQVRPESTAAGTLAKIENDGLADEILGPSSTPEIALGYSPALEQFRKLVPLPTTTFAAPVATANLLKLVGRLEKVQKRAPERQRAVASILTAFRRKLGGPKNPEAWARLQESCKNLVDAALLA
jgi:hypothetical protein